MNAKDRVAAYIGNLIMEVESFKDEVAFLKSVIKELEEKAQNENRQDKV